MTKAYSKTTWLDEILAGSPKYIVIDDNGNTIYDEAQISLATAVSQNGTAMNAAHLNNMENGIDALDNQVNVNGVPIINEGGGTALTMDTIPDGYFIRRSGNKIVKDLPNSQFLAVNHSGIQLTPGMVVVFDATQDSSVTTTNKNGDPSIIGVCLDTIAIGVSGRFSYSGVQTVAVKGNVTRGHQLITSSVPGYAADSGVVQRPAVGAIGLAMTSYAGTTGTVQALVSIVPYTSSSVLQQLPTISQNSGNGSISWTHTIDSGTDLLVVSIITLHSAATGKPTSVLFDSTSMDISNQFEQSENNWTHSGTFAFIRTPSVGAHTITVNVPSSTYVAGIAMNFIGSQSSPFRASVSSYSAGGTSTSIAPTSAVGDIVIDTISTMVSTAWTQGAGQTETEYWTGNPYGGVSTQAGNSGTTTMGWSGVSSAYLQFGLAIKGS